MNETLFLDHSCYYTSHKMTLSKIIVCVVLLCQLEKLTMVNTILPGSHRIVPCWWWWM